MSIKNSDHSFDAPDDVFRREKLMQHFRFHRQWTKPARNRHAETSLTVANHRSQTDVVDRGRDAILGASGEGDLEFAGQIVGEFFMEKRKCQAARVGLDVKRLLR